jgi:fumarate reductase subunit C
MNQQDNNNHLEATQTNVKYPFIITIMHKLIPFSMIWVSLVLMYGVVCMYTNGVGQDEFYRFIFFLRSPFIVGLNCIALFISVFHTIIWFNLFPKMMSSTVFNKKTNTLLVIAGLWAVTLAVSIFLFLFVLK